MEALAISIQDVRVKHSIHSRLQLALKIRKPSVLLREVFSSIQNFTMTEFLSNSIPFANQSQSHFDYWFDYLIELACLELFDPYGNLRPEFLQVMNLSHYWDTLQEICDANDIKQCMLYSYCQQFVGKDLLGRKNLKELQQRYCSRMETLLHPSCNVNTIISRFNDQEWQRLQEIWRWTQYFAKDVVHAPLRFCTTIKLLYQAIFYYVERHNELPLDEDKLTTITEKLAEEMGLISVEQAQAEKISSLYDTFHRLATKKLYHEKIQPLFQKNEKFYEVPATLASLIAQFFILGVSFQQHSEAKINVSYLIRTHDPEINAIEFLHTFSSNHQLLQSPLCETRNFIKSIKTLLRKNLNAHCQGFTLAQRIEWLLDARQTLLFWLKDSADQLITLTEKSSAGLALLAEIDGEISHWSRAVPCKTFKP